MSLVTRLTDSIKMKRKRIVVIGDAMIDRWVDGYTGPCQDDCAKFVVQSYMETPGGAMNAERSLSNWCGVDTITYGQGKGRRPVKSRYIENGMIRFRVDDETMDRALLVEREAGLEMVKHAGAVLISDYNKAFLTPDYIAKIIALCNMHGIPCVCDCIREPSIYRGAILKGNQNYLNKYSSRIQFTDNVIITYGARNPIAWDGGATNGLGRDLQPVKCINHVGAGDCFAAHMTLALAYGFSLTEAATIAHSAGRVYVQYPLNRPPEPDEIDSDLSNLLQ